MYEAYLQNSNRLPYGHVGGLLSEMKGSHKWLTRNIINKAFMKFRKDLKNVSKKEDEKESPIPEEMNLEKSTISSALTMSTVSFESDFRLGRPVGSTDEKKCRDRKKIIDAKNEIVKKIAAAKNTLKEGKRMKRGKLKQIIKSVSVKRGVSNKILPGAIRRRVEQNSLVNYHVGGGQVSQMQKIEPTIVEIILQMARIRQCLTPSTGLQLVNSLIKDTTTQKDLLEWKKRGNSNNMEGYLRRGYWRRFMARNKEKIVSKRGQKYELNRQNWTTYANFVHMYDHCINEMVEAVVAAKLHEPVWMDRYCKICDERNAYGCKVDHKLIRPDMCICGDEVGGSISMKGDGHVGGQLMLVGKGQVPMKKISTNDKKFTLIGLTAFTGEPVMCVLILEGKRPNPSVEAGIDIRITPNSSCSDADFIMKNCGNGKYLPGGPELFFEGRRFQLLSACTNQQV